MDKNKLMKFFFVMLPVMAVGLGTTANAVSIYQPAEDLFVYGSFFQMLGQAGDYQLLPPLAGCTAIGCAIVSALWAIRGGKGLLQAAKGLCAAAVIFAVIPVAFCKTCFFLPSPFFGLILAVHFVLAMILEKEKPRAEKSGKRLED